jgi:hypothetical protein
MATADEAHTAAWVNLRRLATGHEAGWFRYAGGDLRRDRHLVQLPGGGWRRLEPPDTGWWLRGLADGHGDAHTRAVWSQFPPTPRLLGMRAAADLLGLGPDAVELRVGRGRHYPVYVPWDRFRRLHVFETELVADAAGARLAEMTTVDAEQARAAAFAARQRAVLEQATTDEADARRQVAAAEADAAAAEEAVVVAAGGYTAAADAARRSVRQPFTLHTLDEATTAARTARAGKLDARRSLRTAQVEALAAQRRLMNAVLALDEASGRRERATTAVDQFTATVRAARSPAAFARRLDAARCYAAETAAAWQALRRQLPPRCPIADVADYPGPDPTPLPPLVVLPPLRRLEVLNLGHHHEWFVHEAADSGRGRYTLSVTYRGRRVRRTLTVAQVHPYVLGHADRHNLGHLVWYRPGLT